MTAAPVTTPRNTIQLEAIRLPVKVFEGDFAGYCICDAEYTASGNVVSGLAHVAVYLDAEMIALYDAGQPEFVTVLTASPSERMLRVAAEVVAESGI